MILDIINISDAILMVTDDREAAAIACVLVGNGQLGLHETGVDTESGSIPFDMPLFLFGGHDAWWTKTFGHDFETGAKVYRDEKCHLLIAALDSVVYGTPADLVSYNDAMELITQLSGQQEFKRRWNDHRRGSINDIGGRCRGLALALAKDLKKEPASNCPDCGLPIDHVLKHDDCGVQHPKA